MCELNSGRAGLVEEPLAVVEQTLDPRDQLLVGVVGVQHDAHAVVLGEQVDVASRGDRAEDLGERSVGQPLAGEELGATVRQLHDDVAAVRGGRLQHRVDGVGAGDVDGRQRVAARLGRADERVVVGSGDHPRSQRRDVPWWATRSSVISSIRGRLGRRPNGSRRGRCAEHRA